MHFAVIKAFSQYPSIQYSPDPPFPPEVYGFSIRSTGLEVLGRLAADGFSALVVDADAAARDHAAAGLFPAGALARTLAKPFLRYYHFLVPLHFSHKQHNFSHRRIPEIRLTLSTRTVHEICSTPVSTSHE